MGGSAASGESEWSSAEGEILLRNPAAELLDSRGFASCIWLKPIFKAEVIIHSQKGHGSAVPLRPKNQEQSQL
jgi:hypothetical protein